MSKWISIREKGTSKTGKTRVWGVLSKRTGAEVGEIRWYGGWRKYAFFPAIKDADWIVFDAECMMMVAEYCDAVNAMRREKHGREE